MNLLKNNWTSTTEAMLAPQTVKFTIKTEYQKNIYTNVMFNKLFTMYSFMTK